MNSLLKLLAAAIPLAAVPSRQTGHDQELFRTIFGEQICRFDSDAVERVKKLKPGAFLMLDTNGDGKNDTAYFIDPDPKHDDRFRPILVKIVDRDGDMDRDGGPDRDSDLYVADLHADGTVDSVVEYIDKNDDNALDEMGIYTYSASSRYLGTDTIQLWWSRDIGQDHKLWETVNYRYQQKECQFRSHFNGDEIFSNYVFNAAARQWVPGWENPFAIYDEDRDNLSEVVIRFSGSGDRIESMRYSFDADNDAAGGTPHNYDFGFTCLASRKQDDGRTIPLPPALTERNRLWNIEAGPVLAWLHARKFGEQAPWGRVLLSWVENDNNIDASPTGDPRGRWEGVIASSAETFPQVGGPPVGPFNVRYETDLDNSGGMKLYYSPVDRRIHLRGADEAWLKVDYDFDGKLDLAVRYKDTNQDGMIDEWGTDVDGDGVADRTIRSQSKAKPVSLEYKRLVALYTTSLDEALAQNDAIIGAMKSVLHKNEDSFREEEAEAYFRDQLPLYRQSDSVGRRIHDSREGKRFYQDIVRERYFARLRKALAGRRSLHKIERMYDTGNYTGVATALHDI